MTFFVFAVPKVFGDYAVRVGEGILRQRESHPVLVLVFGILVAVPPEPRLVQVLTLAQQRDKSHINVCISVWLRVTSEITGLRGFSHSSGGMIGWLFDPGPFNRVVF